MATQKKRGHGGHETFYRRGEWVREYQIREFIAGGGFGEVYRVRDAEGKQFALKVARDRSGKIALDHEAAMMRAYGDHPCLPRLHGFWVDGGWAFLVMEYVEGENLYQLQTRLGRALTSEEAVGLLSEMLRALEHLHRRGILHLDIKPAQFVREDRTGRVVLLDYGLARRIVKPRGSFLKFWERPRPSVWLAGFSGGTPGFMAPEQDGNGSLVVDERTDLYGLGATMYELLTDDSPPQNEWIPKLAGNPSIHPLLADVVDRMTAWFPEDRFSSALDVADALFRN